MYLHTGDYSGDLSLRTKSAERTDYLVVNNFPNFFNLEMLRFLLDKGQTPSFPELWEPMGFQVTYQANFSKKARVSARVL